jgi:hypothetical protein
MSRFGQVLLLKLDLETAVAPLFAELRSLQILCRLFVLPTVVVGFLRIRPVSYAFK